MATTTITLYKNNSDTNYVSKNVNVISDDINFNFEGETPILTPTIHVIVNDPSKIQYVNYLKIKGLDTGLTDWARRDKYFYVANVRHKGGNMYHFELKCDTLMTYKPEILATNGIIERNESAYNLYIQDTYHKSLAYPKLATLKFPNGFSEYNSFVVNTFGSYNES